MNYEIFISFKHSDENGKITQDCKIAKETYNYLTSLGYSVFFSENTLEQIGSSQYKNDIDTALDSAKIMIVVLTKAEYASTQWVQYEWDSFYNDYLSGVRPDANLFTLTLGVTPTHLPRTLRNVQNFDYADGIEKICKYVSNILPKATKNSDYANEDPIIERGISIISGRQITQRDIRDAVELDSLVYDDVYHVDTTQCEGWYRVNPDIYVMAKDDITGKVIAYVNISPVTDECYEKIKKGDFIDTGITADMILSYDMPFPYSIYFSSIVIHPDYQNSNVFMKLLNAIINKFVYMGEHEVYIKRMLADAVTTNGEKFCKLFGMTKLKGSNHESTLYEITMIPPKFRILSKKCKQLYDYYQQKNSLRNYHNS